MPNGTSIAQQVVKAALLSAVFTVLASQELRFEGFEAEKVGLLGILTAVSVGGALLGRGRQPKRWWLRGQGNALPLLIAVGALVGVTVASTSISISPARSLWGSPTRSQGLLSVVIYLTLFWQATRLGQNLSTALLPSLLVAAIPLCLFGLATFTGIDPALTPSARPGSTTGNANFLSSWLVIAMLFFSPLLAYRLWRSNRRSLWLQGAYFSGILILCLVTLIVAGGRGAFLGLLAGTAVQIVAFAALTGKRRRSVRWAGFVLIGLVAMALLSWAANPRQSILRLNRLATDSRLILWQGGVKMAAQQSVPLLAADGSPDRCAGLRPLIGYGPDTTEFLQARFDPEGGVGQRRGEILAVDRLHNLAFDTLATLGWVGVVTWFAIYEAAMYLGLRTLNLMADDEWRHWLLIQLAATLIGLISFRLLFPGVPVFAFIPLAVSLGAFLGTLAWPGKRVFQAKAPSAALDERHVTLVALTSIIVARLIDNQFSFHNAATQPLWWIMCGLLMGHARNLPDPPPDSHFEERDWQFAALGTGLFMAHSLGIGIQSQVLTQRAGSERLLIGLLLLTLLASILGARLTSPPSQPSQKRMGGWTLVASTWIVFLAFKYSTRVFVGQRLDRIFGQSMPIELFPASVPILAMSGIVLALCALGGYVLLRHPQMLRRTQSIVLTVFFLAGSTAYVTQYVPASLHALGNTASTIEHPTAFALSDHLFKRAVTCTPGNSKQRVDWVYSLMRGSVARGDAESRPVTNGRIVEQLLEIQHRDPFYELTTEWDALTTAYAAF